MISSEFAVLLFAAIDVGTFTLWRRERRRRLAADRARVRAEVASGDFRGVARHG